MDDLIKGIREKADKMRYEMRDFMEDMGDEIETLKEIMKEKTGKISNEIRKIIK